MHPDLELALALADAADAVTLRHFRSATLGVRIKPDASPVSEADEAAERAVREILARERPHDAVVGEEYGQSGEGRRRWILDPIDATSNYVRGVPVFGTLIALEDELGVVSAPALGRRWWARRGEGAFCNGTRLQVSDVATIEEAYLGYDSVRDFERLGRGEAFLALARRCRRSRGFGDFWSHMLVAEGALDIAVEPAGLKLWDWAPLRIVVEEAGGRFTDLSGGGSFDDGSVVATNGRLHEAVLEALR